MKNNKFEDYTQAKIFVGGLMFDLKFKKIIIRNPGIKSQKVDSDYICLYFGVTDDATKRLSVVFDKKNSLIMTGKFLVDANGNFLKKTEENSFEVLPEEFTKLLNEIYEKVRPQ